jgi:uncharacterized damage-inducible protein DinB
MTYYGGKELAASFRTVRANTIKIAEEIPENKYDFKPANDCRTIGQTLAHIAVGPRIQREMQESKVTDLTTVNFPGMMQKNAADEARPRTKAEIIAFLKSEGDAFASFLEGLSESFLAERVSMMPGSTPASKTRFEMLLSPKEHEMHHRAQLMTAQRILGQVPHLTREFQERMAARAAAAQAGR